MTLHPIEIREISRRDLNIRSFTYCGGYYLDRNQINLTSEFLRLARIFLYNAGFTEIITPHLTKATGACENIDTMFKVPFFNSSAYLAQTGQLYLETLVGNYEKVWCIGPSFRAENVVDKRHLCEFMLLELEHLGDFEMLLKYIEELLSYCFGGFGFPREKFARITYSKAIETLLNNGFKVSWGDDLSSEMEKFLVGNVPLFITHYPKDIKFFNMRVNPEDPSIVNSADLILPGVGEAVGSAEREYLYSNLLNRLKSSSMYKRLIEKGGSFKDFEWYINHYKDKGNLHSGCGIGINRIIQYLGNYESILETCSYPITTVSLF